MYNRVKLISESRLKKSYMKIANFDINQGSPVFIIAELSANHNGSIQVAIDTIKAAKRAGADAIKFQTYTADTLTIDSRRNDFLIKGGTLWDGKNFYELYQEAYTPWEWHEELFEVAKEEGLICFSSPFDKTAVDFLEKLETPAYKIASFEITDIPLIAYTASKGKPMIISTGIATIEDITLAIETCKKAGNNNIAVLKCTSSYPAPVEEANMVMVKDLAERFNVISGLSDHTIGSTVPVVATCFGAKIIEKHFILDRSIGGPDASFSMDEKEFTEMVNAVRNAEKAMGVCDYALTEKQKTGRDFSRSLYVVQDMAKGDLVTEENVRSIRPGFGLHPKHLVKVLGKKVKSSLKKGDRFSLSFVQA
jgi:pseudaminic acid synthase